MTCQKIFQPIRKCQITNHVSKYFSGLWVVLLLFTFLIIPEGLCIRVTCNFSNMSWLRDLLVHGKETSNVTQSMAVNLIQFFNNRRVVWDLFCVTCDDPTPEPFLYRSNLASEVWCRGCLVPCIRAGFLHVQPATHELEAFLGQIRIPKSKWYQYRVPQVASLSSLAIIV